MANFRRDLERRAEAAEARAAELQRRLSIYEAGLGNLNDAQRAGLFAVHEGPMTAEALRATATGLYGEV